MISPPLECLLPSVGNVDDDHDSVNDDEGEDVHGGEDHNNGMISPNVEIMLKM